MTRPKRKKTTPSSGSDSNVFDDAMSQLNDDQRFFLSIIEDKLSSISNDFKCKMDAKDAKIEGLEATIVDLKRKVVALENKIDDTEAYERRDTLIFSGGDLPPVTEGENTAQIVTTIVKEKLKVVLDNSNISVSHRLGSKPANQAPDRRNIIVKLCRREVKSDLMRACKKMKPPNFFINESLTRVRSTTLYGLRQARKKYPNIIGGCGSFDGSVYAYIKPPNPDSPSAKNSKVLVNTKDKFNELCENLLKCNPSTLINNWPV